MLAGGVSSPPQRPGVTPSPCAENEMTVSVDDILPEPKEGTVTLGLRISATGGRGGRVLPTSGCLCGFLAEEFWSEVSPCTLPQPALAPWPAP